MSTETNDQTPPIVETLLAKEAQLDQVLEEINAIAKDTKNVALNNSYFRLIQMKKSYQNSKQQKQYRNATSILNHLFMIASKSLDKAKRGPATVEPRNAAAKPSHEESSAHDQERSHPEPSEPNDHASSGPNDQNDSSATHDDDDAQSRLDPSAPNFVPPTTTTAETAPCNKKKSKKKDSTAANKNNKKANNTKKTNSRKPQGWWRSIDEMDPITMDPIAQLPYPPFELSTSTEEAIVEHTATTGRKGGKNKKKPQSKGIVHYFDGKVLAQYIVSTGTFLNPNNRQPLERATCRRLDQYLIDNRLGRATVTDAFDLAKVVEIANSSEESESARNRSEALRREATVLLGSLFQFNRYGETPSNPSWSSGRGRRGGSSRQSGTTNRRQQQQQTNVRGVNPIHQVDAVVHQEGNLLVRDGDNWEDMADALDQDAEFPSISAMGSGGTSSTKSTQPAAAPSWPIRATPGQAPIASSHAEFPQLDQEQGSAGQDDGDEKSQRPRFYSSKKPSTMKKNARWSKMDPFGATTPSISDATEEPEQAAEATASSTPKTVSNAFAGSSSNKSSSLPASGLSSSSTMWERAAASAVPAPAPVVPKSTVFSTSLPTRPSGSQQPATATSTTTISTSSAVYSNKTEGLLCPYLPSMFEAVREFGINWVSGLEAKLFDFVRPGNNTRNLDLGVMNTRKRAFVHELCQNYWSLETCSIHREPNREINVSRLPTSGPPEVTLVKAMMEMSKVLTITRGYTYTAHGFSRNAIGLWDITTPGGKPPTSAQIYGILERHARQSEYHIVFVGDNHVILEFATHAKGRKVHQALVASCGKLGSVKFRKAQWWPCGTTWATHQLDQIHEEEAAKRLRLKQEKQLLKKLERMNKDKEDAKLYATGWDSDGDEDIDATARAFEATRPQEATVQKNKSKGVVKKEANKAKSAGSNLWAAFGSDSDSDESSSDEE